MLYRDGSLGGKWGKQDKVIWQRKSPERILRYDSAAFYVTTIILLDRYSR